MNFLAVDVGSTYIKVAVYDLEFKKVIYTRKYYTPERIKTRDSHYFEVEAQKIVECIKDIIRNCSCITQELDGILFSTQQHGCVLHHPQRGKDMYISWQDTRCLKIDPETGKSYMDEISELLPASVMARTGVPVKPALAICNLYALFKEETLRKGKEAIVYTLGSYIIEKLTGNNTCHITNAAPLGFMNLKENQWDMDILRRVGLDFLTLPKITTQFNALGRYYEGDWSINVYPDLGDVQTSIYGSHAVSGDMIINIGTSGQLILLKSDYDSASYNPNKYEVRPYYDNNYCYVISRMPGGRNFDVQVDYLRAAHQLLHGTSLERDEVWKILEGLEMPESPNGVEVDCSFYELPDTLANGSIKHLTKNNFTPQNVFAATAISFGNEYKKYAEVILNGEKFEGVLHFTGGAVLKNEYLRKTISRIMNVDKVVSANTDEVYGGLFRIAICCTKGNNDDIQD